MVYSLLLVVFFNVYLSSFCSASRSSLMDIYDNYTSGPVFYRSKEYVEIYQNLFAHYKLEDKLTFLEIGVQSGGAMVTWKQWFSDSEFTYVGIDINPLCKQFENEEDKNYVEIGSQTDPVFLQSVCEKHGPFDIIIDDGGHTAEQIITSLRTLYPCVVEGGFYVIEDVYTVATFDKTLALFEGKTVTEHIAKIYESKHYYHTEIEGTSSGLVSYDPIFSDHIKSIQLVDSMIIINKGTTEVTSPLHKGTILVPYEGNPEITAYFSGKEIKFHINIGMNSAVMNINQIYTDCYSICETNYDREISSFNEYTLNECAKRLMDVALKRGYGYDIKFVDAQLKEIELLNEKVYVENVNM